jgi:hypothetical protein
MSISRMTQPAARIVINAITLSPSKRFEKSSLVALKIIKPIARVINI